MDPTPTTSLATQQHTGMVAYSQEWDQEQRRVLKATLCKDLTDAEFDLFAQVCKRKGLDPFSGQIHAVKRGKGANAKMSIQTGIDGFRLQAVRTGLEDGQDPPQWCGPDGIWVDIWLEPAPPVAVKVLVWKKGVARPYVGMARWDAYAQWKQEWQNGVATGRQVLNDMWDKMGPEQLAKCAEAAALRKAYPVELSGLYTHDEMGQADNDTMLESPQTDTSGRAEGESIDAYRTRMGGQPVSPPPQHREQTVEDSRVMGLWVRSKSLGVTPETLDQLAMEAWGTARKDLLQLTNEDLTEWEGLLNRIAAGEKYVIEAFLQEIANLHTPESDPATTSQQASQSGPPAAVSSSPVATSAPATVGTSPSSAGPNAGASPSTSAGASPVSSASAAGAPKNGSDVPKSTTAPASAASTTSTASIGTGAVSDTPAAVAVAQELFPGSTLEESLQAHSDANVAAVGALQQAQTVPVGAAVATTVRRRRSAQGV